MTKVPVPVHTVRSPERWVISGLTLQAVGVLGAAAYSWLKLRREGIGGHLTAATIRLAWHAEVHTRTGLLVLAGGAVIYAAGTILMARPYLAGRAILFVAVAAIVGMLALGVLALVVAALLAALAYDVELPFDFDLGRRHDGPGSGRRRRRL